jgi:uncharacterized protein
LKSKPVLVVTHTDMDGVAAYMVAAAAFGEDNILVKFADAGEKPVDEAVRFMLKESAKGGPDELVPLLIVVDQCPSNDMVVHLNKLAMDEHIHLWILDHHKTALERLPWADLHLEQHDHNRQIIIDTKSCGTELLFHLRALPTWSGTPDSLQWADSVAAWDAWRLDSSYRKDGEALNDLFKIIGSQKFIKRGMVPKLTPMEEYLVAEVNESRIRRLREDLANPKNVIDAIDAQGRQFVCIVSMAAVEPIRGIIQEMYPDAHYLVVLNPMMDAVQLRTLNNSGVDVGEIARQHGGGGHANASGYPVNLQLRNAFADLVCHGVK